MGMCVDMMDSCVDMCTNMRMDIDTVRSHPMPRRQPVDHGWLYIGAISIYRGYVYTSELSWITALHRIYIGSAFIGCIGYISAAGSIKAASAPYRLNRLHIGCIGSISAV